MYELSQSLGITRHKYSYDMYMYTAIPLHTYDSFTNCERKMVSGVVVGITDSVTTSDYNAHYQAKR